MEHRSSTDEALAELARRLRSRFGDRVVHLVLFGSRARGEATEDSDVDILIVIDGLTFPETRDVDHLVGELFIETDVLLSPLLLSRARYAELRARERRIVAEIDRDGVPL